MSYQSDPANSSEQKDLTFVPTEEEMEVLVKYHTNVYNNTWYIWNVYGSTSGKDDFIEQYSLRRLNDIAAVIGKNVVREIYKKLEEKLVSDFRKVAPKEIWPAFDAVRAGTATYAVCNTSDRLGKRFLEIRFLIDS